MFPFYTVVAGPAYKANDVGVKEVADLVVRVVPECPIRVFEIIALGTPPDIEPLDPRLNQLVPSVEYP